MQSVYEVAGGVEFHESVFHSFNLRVTVVQANPEAFIQNNEVPLVEAHGIRVTRCIVNATSAMPMELLEIDNGVLKLALLPQRGMSIWKAWCNGVFFGWNSPVNGPVHPSLVPIFDPSGLGWLEGFDELLCRCGLSSNGAPDFDSSGKLLYPLHGRIANLPASNIQIQQDAESGAVCISCDVYESRLHFQKLCLRSRLTLKPGAAMFELHDEVLNLSARSAEIQLLYHYNIGEPLLGAGAQVVAPIKVLVPRDQHAATGIDKWQSMAAPDVGYTEQVYFAQLHADAQQNTCVMLKSANGDLAASIQFNTAQLPCFVTWKNAVDVSDGYACGIEPGTNFPNPRTFEGNNGRTVHLGPKGSASFDLTFAFHVTPQEVAAVESGIRALAADKAISISPVPLGGWCIQKK